MELTYNKDGFVLYLLQNDVDTSPINILTNLKVLRIDELRSTLDFSNFKNLRVLSLTHNTNVQNLGSCTPLFWLWIEKYKKEHLIELRDLVNLEFLTLHGGSVHTLKGMESMTNLKMLRTDTLKNLESLQGLNSMMNQLEILDIYMSRTLTDYTCIGDLKNLKQLELRRTGDVDSIKFLKDLPHLKKVTLGFKIRDENVSYLKGIEEVGFIDFPHYSMRMKDFT